MKKLIILTVFVLGITLTGCTDGYASSSELEDINSTLQVKVGDLETRSTNLEDELSATDLYVTELEDALENALEVSNQKLRSAFSRDSWLLRKVNYDASYNAVPAEYCFGVFDEDWSSLVADDYSYGEGLKFVITIEEVNWNTELLVKDSCGNYSEFLYENSPYGLYSMPQDFLSVGQTYSVVLYKDTYFSVPQLGLLPAADMGLYGAYPEDISGIISELIE